MKIGNFVTRWLGRIIMFLRNMVDFHSSSVQSYPRLTMKLLAGKCYDLVRSGKIGGEDCHHRLCFVEIESNRIPADICTVQDKETVGLMVLINQEGVPESVTEIFVWETMDEEVAQHLKEGSGAIEFVLE